MPSESVKIAVRVSDDGVNWSAPLGRNGEPIDWTSRTGNYFGSACGDFTWYGDLSQIPAKRYIDLEVRLASGGVTTPELRKLTLEVHPLYPSTITVTSSSKTLSSYGAAYTFTGVLQSNGTPLTGKRVVLQAAPTSSGPWSNTSVVATTTAGGEFSLSHIPNNKTFYRAYFAGDVSYNSCQAMSATLFPAPG